jgi:hypothetical protein
MNNMDASETGHRFYLDAFMYEVAKAIREANFCQRCAVDRVKKILKEMQPEDTDILTPLSRAVDVGLDSPRRFASFCREALDKAEKNLAAARARRHE